MKSDVKWDQQAQCLMVSGRVTFDTVVALQAKGDCLLVNHPKCVIDFEQVTHGDTCSIILLIGWLRLAKQHGISLSFKNISRQIRCLASVHGVKDLLC